jgi:putative protease
LPYTSTLSGKDKYYLSPSDQCFIENLKLLEEWGVDSLKIEGRLKAPHYVGQVVREYRLALEGAKSPNYAELLRRAYNRGSFTKGYNFDATKDLMSINVQGNIGEYVGVVKKRANSSLYLELEKELHLKDGVKVLYNGAEIGGFLVDNIKRDGEFFVVKINKVYP